MNFHTLLIYSRRKQLHEPSSYSISCDQSGLEAGRAVGLPTLLFVTVIVIVPSALLLPSSAVPSVVEVEPTVPYPYISVLIARHFDEERGNHSGKSRRRKLDLPVAVRRNGT